MYVSMFLKKRLKPMVCGLASAVGHKQIYMAQRI
jgi:hypothetical protein